MIPEVMSNANRQKFTEFFNKHEPYFSKLDVASNPDVRASA